MDTSTPSRILNCVNRLRTWKHLTRNIPLLTLFMFIWWKIYAAKTPKWDEYGSYAYVLFFFRLLPLLSLPFCLMNFLGIFAYPLQLPHLNFEASVKGFAAPFLSFRVVTRGLFPDLVATNVQRNLKTCYELGLENFQIEVVTDRPVNLPSHRNLREIVVPEDFRPPNGCKFKARALQYCLEPSVNVLNDNDWIIHLDEETILTPDSVKGCFNFAARGEFHFGQGVITYTNLGIVNPILTLADSVRVANDYGLIRFQFSRFHLPLFSMKGSFVVANAGAERQVTWDHGPEGSIAEDAFFALIAMAKGYKFGFIPAEMWESSPYTFGDYLKQRRRWLEGLRLLFLSSRVPLYVKPGITFTVLSWSLMPLTSLGVIITKIYQLPVVWLDILHNFITINYIFMVFLGTCLSFSRSRIGIKKLIGYVLMTIPAFVVMFLGENLAAILTWFDHGLKFNIVQKEKKQDVSVPKLTLALNSNYLDVI